MQSRTSFFNKAIFLNTLKRFWPLWFVYLAIWLIILPGVQAVNYYNPSSPISLYRDILDTAQFGGIFMGMGYSILSAMAVWSFMYNSKTMSGVACLPVKREGVFVSAGLAGLLPALASNIVAFGLTMLVHAGRGFGSAIAYDAVGFAIVTMMLIFFYGFATLCAQLTGNLVTLPVVFLVLNFTAWLVESIANYLMDVIVYGLEFGSYAIALYLSPVVGMFEGGVRTHEVYNELYGKYEIGSVSYEGLGFLAVCCAVGVVMLIGALLLYRRRRMESVGDVVAVPVLKGVFKYCMTFGCALVSGIGFYGLFVQAVVYTPILETLGILFFMLVGAFIGYFAAEMLIRKSFRVFRGRWKGLLVGMLIICVCVMGLEFDLLGLERKIPEAEDVDYVHVYGSDGVTYRERENIEAAIELHRSAVENKSQHESGIGIGSSFMLDYYLKDGSSFSRRYYLCYNAETLEGLEDVEALENLQNSTEAIAFRKGLPFEATEEKVLGGYFRGFVAAEELFELNPDMSEEDLIIINYYGYDKYYVLHEMSEAEKLDLVNDLTKYQDRPLFYGNNEWQFTPEEMWELYSTCIVPDLNEGKVGKLWIIEDEEYFNTVCSGKISIDFWCYPQEAENSFAAVADVVAPTTRPYFDGDSGKQAYTFTTTPTVGSRTYDWLIDHGVVLHTVGEEFELTDGFTNYGKYN